MKIRWIATTALIGLAALTTGRSYAQAPIVRPPGSPASLSPAYSPYLNLLRRGNPAFVNYYGLVRPQFQFQNQISGLQQGQAANTAALSGVDPTTGLPITGHPTQFLNTSHYFLNRGGQGAPAGAAPIATRYGRGPSAPTGRSATPTPRY